MVSINKIINLGLLGAAALAFVYLGGAKGIGQSIGGGLTSFGSGIASSFKFPTFQNKTLEEKFPEATSLDIALEEKKQELNRPLTSQEIRDVASTITPADESPISLAFKPAIDSGAITPAFAQKYSFQPPASGGALDVSSIFKYIAEPVSSAEIARRTTSNFGGYGSAINQTTALAQAIEINAAAFPEWFA
ncbi:MAG: hypothetical protein ABGY11_05270 [Candidatus Thioglobus sp.]|jgi:hypothetical protein